MPVLYECIEWLQQRPELYAPTPIVPRAPSPTPNVEKNEETLKAMQEMKGRVIHGEPFTERKSTFQVDSVMARRSREMPYQAHLCDVTSAEEVQTMMQYLLSNNKIRNATHNILAYRLGQKITLSPYHTSRLTGLFTRQPRRLFRTVTTTGKLPREDDCCIFCRCRRSFSKGDVSEK